MSSGDYWDLRSRQRGLSLVEILVGMTVGLILMAGVIQIFVSSKQGYRIQTALSRLQENGRFAIEFINRDIRGAGFFGCAGNATRIVNTLNNADQYAWDFSTALQGFEAQSNGTWLPALNNSITNVTDPDPLSGRDIITLRHATGNPTKVTKHPGNPNQDPGSADIQVNPGNGLSQGDIAMISDCVNSAIFQITNNNPDTSGTLVHNTGVNDPPPGNVTKKLGKEYEKAGSVIRLTTTTYYIRSDSEDRPSLYRLKGTDDVDELIEGVEDMQILYGEDIDGNRGVSFYATADKVAIWDNVISVRISLLLRTLEDNLASSPQSYTFNGATTTPSDRRLRRVFTVTVNLRNRAL